MTEINDNRYLLVCATLSELAPLVNKMDLVRECTPQLKTFGYKNLHIDLLVTGIGMINTCYWLTKTLSERKYKLAVNAGIAGTFNAAISIGETVEIISEVFSETGAEDGSDFLDITKLGLVSGNEFPFTENRLINSTKIKNRTLDNLRNVNAVTVNKVHGNASSIAQTVQLFNCDIETMEGAAFFYCCLNENIPFLQLRTISNYVERRNREKWNIPLAIANLNVALSDFFKAESNF